MIAVGVEREGPCWNLLASFDVLATTAEGGWVNAGFAPEAEVIRPSQEAMGREDGIAGRLEKVNS